jgi:hypothetical protein
LARSARTHCDVDYKLREVLRANGRARLPDTDAKQQGVKYLTEFRDWKGQRSTNSMGTPRTVSGSMVQRARDDVMPVTVDLMARTYGGRRRPECQICGFQ